MKFMEEAEQLILASNNSHFPFGESYLMAEGIQLTDNDLLRSARPYESELLVSGELLLGSDYALQLAARSGRWKRGETFMARICARVFYVKLDFSGKEVQLSKYY